MIIYKITCKCQKVYIGSTETTLEQRKKYHKTDFFKNKTPLYQHVRECCAFDDLIFEELTECDELIRFEIEQEYIDTYNSIQEGLNDRRAIKNPTYHLEWSRNNRDKIKICRDKHKHKYKEYWAKRYQDNKEQQLARQAEQVECECGTILTRGKLARHRRTKKHLNKVRN